ncbi:probable E3 SUMO-protein ligase RNF212 isoform X2 [Photinus pyralis]|uniref:probable E3 SUMO-protein ligase RNF212 isoform X2 n=1 Tax=Photinus pyralis TaxID=7054 RepID=UPI00126782AE|nr:probable E3 SUMO-protein ligase RNF212 isoform X2 [Photinus pyralis]
MAEFVNCNKCFSTYNPDVAFYVANCGHMQCEPCISKSDKTKCVVCNSPSDLIPLNNNLAPELQPFFRSVGDLFDKARQVNKFQDFNKNLVIKSLTDKYKLMKTKVYKCYKLMQDAKKENEKLRLHIQNLAKTLPTSTPATAGVPAIFPSPGNSVISSIFPKHRSGTALSRPGQQVNTPWNNSSKAKQAPHMSNGPPMSNVSHSFMTPSQSSMGENTIEESFDQRTPIPRIPNSVKAPLPARPVVMMPMARHLKLDSKNKPR